MAKQRPGATGRFPRGKARADDEGELAVAVSVRGNEVFIDFGKPIAWLALSPDECQQFVNLLQGKLMTARYIRTEGG